MNGSALIEATASRGMEARTPLPFPAILTKTIKDADERLDAYLQQMDENDSTDKAAHSGDHGLGGGSNIADKIARVQAKQDRHKSLLKQMARVAKAKYR